MTGTRVLIPCHGSGPSHPQLAAIGGAKPPGLPPGGAYGRQSPAPEAYGAPRCGSSLLGGACPLPPLREVVV